MPHNYCTPLFSDGMWTIPAKEIQEDAFWGTSRKLAFLQKEKEKWTINPFFLTVDTEAEDLDAWNWAAIKGQWENTAKAENSRGEKARKNLNSWFFFQATELATLELLDF